MDNNGDTPSSPLGGIKQTSVWMFLAILGLVLVIAGFQGSFGRVLAVVFTPGDLTVYQDSNTNQGTPITSAVTGVGASNTTGATVTHVGPAILRGTNL